ncbi:MAG: shikimate dehydrogenase [Anaerolineae bacterium]|nr:shikimate dehydrogenase [Anaerolineae bacterium]
MSTSKIIKKKVPTFYFIGVTTGQSLIMKVFPRWMKELGRPQVVIEGIDHPLHDAPEAYRASVAQIRDDPLSLGALVTTHKMDVYAAAEDMFDYLDPYARTTHELSSISKRAGRLEGHAKDPVTAGLSMDSIVGKNYFARAQGQVLCLGAGGSALATLLHLINKKDKGDRPERFIAVNRSQPRLDHMRRMVEQYPTDIQVEYILNSNPRRNDEIIAGLPAGSIVINATGMGKDTPGSPLTDEAMFPQNGIAWEFNYRGELDFIQQALRQTESRNLRVEDGWVYFLHGWTQVIAQVLHLPIEGELFNRLAEVANVIRS